MFYGVIARSNVPMVMTFEEGYVEDLCESLGNAIHMSYVGMFDDRDEVYE